MTPRSAANRYTAVAIALHWVIALLILTNLALGLRMVRLEGLAMFEMIQLHKSIGITVLVLSVARLGWRLTHRPPALPGDISRGTRALASAVHWLFYGLMLGLPITGWLMVSASPTNIPTLLYRTLPWPHLPWVHDLAMPARLRLADAADSVHVALTYIAYLLIAMHVGAALKHQFLDADGVLWRMLPLPFLRKDPSR